MLIFLNMTTSRVLVLVPPLMSKKEFKENYKDQLDLEVKDKSKLIALVCGGSTCILHKYLEKKEEKTGGVEILSVGVKQTDDSPRSGRKHCKFYKDKKRLNQVTFFKTTDERDNYMRTQTDKIISWDRVLLSENKGTLMGKIKENVKENYFSDSKEQKQGKKI
jgi:hypothetical protein